MRKTRKSSRLISLLLVLAMVMTFLPFGAFAAVGDLAEGDTELSTDINTSDTISLPIKIYDYQNDGMLFEYAETQGSSSNDVWLRAENVSKPSASIKTDFTLGKTGYGAVAYSSSTYTSGAAASGNTSTMKWLKWAKDKESACLSVFDKSEEGYSATSYAVSAIRYLALVYRSTSGTASDTAQFDMWNDTTGARTSKVSVTYDNRGTTWRYMIVDLGSVVTTKSNKVTAVYGYLPSGTGVAFAGYFSSKADAEAYGEAALKYTGETYHYAGDNRAFGLLRYSRTTAYGANSTDDNISNAKASAGIVMANTYNGAGELDVSTLDLGYDYTLKGTFTELGIATLGLLQSSLSSDGLPVYKEATVDYVAELLKDSLAIPEVDSSKGYKNYQFVQGATDERFGGIDFAQWLRNHCTSMGSYAASSKKDLIGKWDEVSGNITTWYDAAYFMLNSIFVGGSYNVAMDDYDYLVLSAATNSDGKKVYVFDGGFADNATPASAKSAVAYDETDNTIQNSSAAGKTRYYYEGDNTTTYYPLLPIVDEDGNNTNGVTSSPYFLDPGVTSTSTGGNTYKNRNYNYVMASNGEFVYHADDELFFYFEGDDDVYLFIDGKLVLDIGGAHSISQYKMNVNDYASILGLKEGNTYSFDFYYMERHGVGANMRIETNIRVTDPSMNTAKTAWQGSQLDFGSIVDPKQVVEYGFAITNNGEANLYNLTFTDNDIGVTLDPTNGLTVTGNRVSDVEGGTLEASDLTAVVSHPDYDDINVTFADNAALKKFLKELTASGTENGAGLYIGATVQIRGIGYTLTDEQVKAGVFDNTVLTTSTNKTESKKLQGQATMRVFVPADPMYYEWAGHKLSVTKTKLVTDVLAAANQADNILNGKVSNLTTSNVNKIELVTKAGTAITSPYVTIDGSYNLTINYDSTGSKVFYVKITYNSSKNTVIVPVLVNVTDVQDSVYVLDYGLSVNLTEGGELTKNDTLTVPGRTTSTSVLAIGSNGAYSPNEITFSSATTEVEGTDGKFAINGQTIKYTPTDFMEGIDTVQVAMNVYESDITPSKITGTLDINNEVEMYKKISVLPATVVYYEDCFPAIHYSDSASKTQTNTFTALGSQSNDQDQEYGQDEYYQSAENAKASAESLTTITITDNSQIAYFTFKGTGFELIGRTNAYDSATLSVKVEDENGNTVKNIPVITEFDNDANGGKEEIYQVPVIRVKDLDLATYTVKISGVPARDYDNLDDNGNPTIIPTILYVDGLRIYQPMGATNENYTDEENGAQFIEIRNKIVDGYIAAVSYDGEKLDVSTGTTTWTEQYEKSNSTSTTVDGKIIYTGNEVDSVEDYLIKGPNNEVYMNGDLVDSALAFYVTKTNGATVNNLQIAVHAVDPGLFYAGATSGMNTVIQYGVLQSDGKYAWAPLATVTSGTEQYYTIDLTNCYTDANGRIQVVVRVASGMASFTSLKLNGLELSSIGGETTDLYYVNGILSKYVEQIPETQTESEAETVNAASDDINLTVSQEATTLMASGETESTAVDATEYADFQSISAQMRATAIWDGEDTDDDEIIEEEPSEPEVEPSEPEVEPSEPEVDPSEPEEEPDEPSYGGSDRTEMIKKILEMLKKFWIGG